MNSLVCEGELAAVWVSEPALRIHSTAATQSAHTA